MKLKLVPLAVLTCLATASVPLLTGGQSGPAATQPSTLHFGATIRIELLPDRMNPRGIDPQIVADGVARFFKSHEKRDFTLDDLGNIEIVPSNPSSKDLKARLKEISKFTVTFSSAR